MENISSEDTRGDRRHVIRLRSRVDAGWQSIERACDFVAALVSEFSEDRIPSLAAGVTFFVLLAVFPAMACVISLTGLFADRHVISNIVSAVAPFIPGGAVTIMSREIERVIRLDPDKLNFGLLLGLAVSIWSASGGVRALMEGLNIAYETPERRGFVRRYTLALAFTGIALLLAVFATGMVVFLPRLIRHLSYAIEMPGMLAALVWAFACLIFAVLFEALYFFGPDRPRARWRWLSWGSIFASILFITGTLGFAWYVNNFGTYDRVYGNLGAAVGFLTWVWLCLMIVLAGAELNCEIGRRSRIS